MTARGPEFLLGYPERHGVKRCGAAWSSIER
jgi:hypothetical protein